MRSLTNIRKYKDLIRPSAQTIAGTRHSRGPMLCTEPPSMAFAASPAMVAPVVATYASRYQHLHVFTEGASPFEVAVGGHRG